jgi:uridine phosphorylase
MALNISSYTQPATYLAYWQGQGLFLGKAPATFILSYLPWPKELTPLPYALPVLGGKGKCSHQMQDAPLTDEAYAVISLNSMGAPALAILLEALIAWGGKRFILIGTAGSLGTIQMGDLITPTQGWGEDGVSQEYHRAAAGHNTPRPSWCFPHQVWQENFNAVFTPVKLVTTDAFFLETPTKVQAWQALGIKAIDLEAAAFFKICQLREVPAAAAMVISDIVQEAWRPKFKQAELSTKALELWQKVLAIATSPFPILPKIEKYESYGAAKEF